MDGNHSYCQQVRGLCELAAMLQRRRDSTLPVVGPLANAANEGISAMRGNTQSAALSLTGSIPFLGTGGFNPYESGLNQITSDMLSKTNLYNLMSESLLMRGVNGDAAAMNDWKQRIAALPAREEELTPFEKSKRARAEIKPTNEFVKFLKENIADPFADNIDYVRYETWGGRLVDRFGYSAASMIGPPVVDQPTTGNEIVDKIADFTGGAAGLVVNPGGVGTSTQNLFTTTNKMATSLAATKGGQIVQNTMSKSLEKVLNPKYAGAAQRITQYTLNGAVTGSLHSTSLSLIQNKSSGKELLEAALWGGAFGGAFGALGGMLSPVLGKVFTAARQYTSKLKPNQIIANLKQSMKQKVVTGNPLAANPIRKGLETRGYKPKPGERTTTKEQYKAQEQKTREALRAEKADGTGEAGSSGSKGVLNVKQVEYGSDNLSKAAQQFRIDNNITGGQNVLIAEVEVNGVVKRYQIVSTREEIVVGEETIEKITHSEKIFDDIMKKEGISPDKVKRMYSEREPCILDGHNCKQLLSKEYPNAEVTYSFEYGDQKSRNRGNKKLKQALKQLFGIN